MDFHKSRTNKTHTSNVEEETLMCVAETLLYNWTIATRKHLWINNELHGVLFYKPCTLFKIFFRLFFCQLMFDCYVYFLYKFDDKLIENWIDK